MVTLLFKAGAAPNKTVSSRIGKAAALSRFWVIVRSQIPKTIKIRHAKKVRSLYLGLYNRRS